MKKLIGALSLVGAGALATPSQAFWMAAGGTPMAGEGEYSSVVGAVTANFNGGAMPAGYVGGQVVTGSSGNTAAPPGDSSHYFNVGPTYGTPGVITLPGLSSYFGFFMGSMDDYNILELWNGEIKLASFTGADFANLLPTNANGDRSKSVYVNLYGEGLEEAFTKVKMISPTNAFESDNHAVLAVPEPGTWSLLGLALFAMISTTRGRVRS